MFLSYWWIKLKKTLRFHSKSKVENGGIKNCDKIA